MWEVIIKWNIAITLTIKGQNKMLGCNCTQGIHQDFVEVVTVLLA